MTDVAPQEIASAYITLKTVGLDRVKKDLAYVKGALADSTKGIDQFNNRLQTTAKLADFAQVRFRSVFASVGKLAGIKLPEQPEPIKPNAETPAPVSVKVQQPEPIKPKVETPAPVSVKAQQPAPVHVEKPKPVVVPVEADTSKAKADVDGIKAKPVTVPVKADKPTLGVKLPSLGIPVSLAGVSKAIGQLGVLKSKIASAATFAVSDVPALRIMANDTKAAIDGFGRLKASIVGVLDKATDVPVLRQLKSGISYVNTKFDDFLKRRYGALAKPIKYSGMAVDMGMMAMGHPIPGGAILGTIPGIAAAESYKQVSGYMARRRDRQAKGENPTLLDKGVSAVGAGASAVGNVAKKGFALASSAIGTLANKIKAIPYGSLLSGLKSVGSTALSVFGGAAGAVSGFLGKLNGSILDGFGNKIKEVGKAVSDSISQVGSVAGRAFAVLSGAIGATVRMAAPVEWAYFTAAIQGISIQIGRIFVPLLRDLTLWLIRVENVLRSLTDGQRQTILSFAKIALVVTGAIVAFTSLFSIVSSGFGVLSGFVGILTALGVSGPVGWIIAIGAAIAGLAAIIAASSGGFAGLFAGVQPLLAGLVAACRTAFNAIAPIIQTVLGGAAGFITTALSTVTPFVIGLATLVASTLGQLSAVVQPLVETIFGSANSNFARVASAVRNTLQGVIGVLTTWAENIVGLWRSVAPELGGVFKALFDIWGDYATYVQGIIQSLLPSIRTFIGLVYGVAVPILTAAVAAVRGYLEALRPIFASLFEIGKSLWDAFGQIADSLMQAAKPLFDAFSGGGGFLAAFNAALQVVLLPLKFFAWLLALAVPVVQFLAEGLVGFVRLAVTLLTPVINIMAAQFRATVDAVQVFAAAVLATAEMMKEIARNPAVLGSQAGLNELGRGFSLEYQRILRQMRQPTQQRPEAEDTGGGGDWGEEPNRNQFRGTVHQPSQLTGIAEAWRKAQTATVADPNTMLLEQQLNQDSDRNSLLEQIRNILQGMGGQGPTVGVAGP